MRVLFDHQVFQLQRRGGATRIYEELLKGFKETDCDTTTFAGFHQSTVTFGALDSPQTRIWGHSFESLPAWAPKANRLMLPLFAKLSGADIYHPTYYVDALPRWRKAKVATCLDMIHEIYPQMFSATDKTAARKRALMAAADRIIAISEATKIDLIRILDIDPSKVRVIPLAQSLPQAAESLRHPRPYVLYVGLRAGYKNFEALARAFAASRLKNDFDLIAFGGPPWTESERSLLQDLKIETVTHYRAGDDSLLAKHYAEARVFVYPSMYEGFGIPPLEAMAQGCPVMAANSSSIPEVVGNAARLFDPHQIDEIVLGLEDICYSESSREEWVARGREREKQFSWDRCMQEHLSLYQELLP